MTLSPPPWVRRHQGADLPQCIRIFACAWEAINVVCTNAVQLVYTPVMQFVENTHWNTLAPDSTAVGPAGEPSSSTGSGPS